MAAITALNRLGGGDLAGLEGTMPINMEGTPPLRGVPYPTLNHTGLEGHPAPYGGQPYPTL